ncbi:MAG: DUF1800 domain-containing protein [Betaproteobacteria bacterium]|nr:DUF1800 domain-containing protein [Betaproteobacteria bacterium]
MGMDDARHFLARTGFGGSVAEIVDTAIRTREEAVARALGGSGQQSAGATVHAAPSWVNDPFVSPRQLRDDPQARRAYQQQEVRRAFELRGWWLNEMVVTPQPLQERMTLFWHNHFTSSQQKVRVAQLMYRQNRLLRRHALGNFAGLLHAVSRDPAMIIYLDAASNRRGQPNENFAREVMELFTLGEGHYTEADIREAARAFTGWSIDPANGEYLWRPFAHDDGVKTILGRSGEFDGDAVLDILLAQPQTAEFIVAKLWREFVSPAPDRTEVARIARRFRDSRYDIGTALHELLLAPAFWAGENRGALVKSPAELVAGTLRQFSVAFGDPLPFTLMMAGLGQNLFAPPNVKGWAGGNAWITSASLLSRKQFLARLLRAPEPHARIAGETLRGESTGTDGKVAGMGEARTRTADSDVKGAPGLGQLGPEGRERLERARSAIRFDANRWLSQFQPGEVDAMRRVLLPADPVGSPKAGGDGRELMRQLVLDPVYQLK